MFNQTLSAILRGSWLISESFAQSHLPVVLNLIKGKASGQEFLSGNGEYEMPFFIQANGRKVDAYFFSRSGMILNVDAMTAGYVAVVPFVGPVTKYDGSCGEPGMIKRMGWVSGMTSNPNCRGYVSIIDSPGGQADGTPQTANLIKSLSVPTAALIVGGAYSAGAWVASGHDNIYLADKYSEIGSIGAYTNIVDYSGYFEKQGIKVTTIYPKISRDKNGAYRKALKGDTAEMEENIGELAQGFVNEFAANRGDRLTSDEWNTGKEFGSVDAIRIGLVDGIKTMDEVISEFLTAAPGSIKKTSGPDGPSISQNNNSNMKNFPNVSALVGAAVPTSDQLDLANADFTAAGITNATIVSQATIDAAQEDAGKVVSLTKEKETLVSDLSTMTTNHNTAVADLATANARIAELEKGPGAKHVGASGGDAVIEQVADDEMDEVLANMPHNKAADKITG